MIGTGRWSFLRSSRQHVNWPRRFSTTNLGGAPMTGRILVVGDGDFSFSVALARQTLPHKNITMIRASSLDSRADVHRRYRHAPRNLRRLAKFQHVQVRHGLDATDIPSGNPWDWIVWNFPYPTGLGTAGTHAAAKCRELVFGFLESCQPCLHPKGRVRVTTLTRNLVPMGDDWNLEQLARQAGLELAEVVPFEKNEFPGYQPKRSFEDTTFPHHQHAKTLLFRHSQQRTSSEESSLPKLGDPQELEQTFQDELELLLKKHKEIYVGELRDLYQQEFKKKSLPLDGLERLGVTLKRAAVAGVCQLETRQGSALWVLKNSADNQKETATATNSAPVEDSPTRSETTTDPAETTSSLHEEDDRKFFQKVHELLQRQPNYEINVGSFAQSYHKQFGTKVPQRPQETTMGATLQRAEKAGVCRLDLRRGGLWLVLPGKQ